MPRTLRHNNPGDVYHLISRCVNNEWLIAGDEERFQYLRLLGLALERSDWRCLAYVVMSNHIHLAVIAGTRPLSSWVRRVHSPFAEWINRRHGRIGAVLARGPSDHGVWPESVAKTIAYIHNNPVRAGVAPYARDSDWSSHRAYVGHVAPPAWLHVEEGLARAGFTDPNVFDPWVNQAPHDRLSIDASKLRRKAQRRGAIELGTPILGGAAEVPLLRRPWAHVRFDPRQVVEVTAAELGMSVLQLCSRRKSPDIVDGRTVAVSCAHSLGLTGTDIAAALGISQQGAAAILHRVFRDDRLIAARDRVVAAFLSG
ncbi:hypothetical protein BH11MYX3_BH11MYX3_06230 [soil metagenome]